MSESTSYFDSPDYFQATDEERALVIEHDFKKLASKSKEYTQASPQKQDAIRAAYQRNVEAEAVKSPFNPSASRASAAQSKANNQGFLPNLWGKAVRSHEEGLAAFELIGDALNPDGTLNPDAAKKSAAYFQKQKEAPVLLEEKQLEADVDKRIKDFNHGDASQKVEAVLGGIWDVITNPKGAMYAGTGSASTITSAFLGGKAASLAAAGLTAATGGAATPAAPFIVAAGSTAAVGAHAGVQNWLENIQKDLDAAGVPHTEANIKAWVEANPDRVLKHQKTALTYGAGMGVLSTASGFLGGKVATSFERAALRQAGTTVEASVSKAAISGIAKETGESVEAVTKKLIDQEARNIMSTQTFKSNILQKAKNLGVEIAGEPVEELGARVISGQEVTAKDLIMETIGGIGAGPYGAAVNKSLYGTEVVADKTKSFVQKVVASTPESRAAAKAQEAEIKVAKVESSSPTNFGFKKDVETTEPTDPKVADWATPGHKSYDPVKAVTVLAKEENPTVDHYDKTRQVYLDYQESINKLYDQQEEQLIQVQTLQKAGKHGEAQIAADTEAKTKLIIEDKVKTLQQIAGQVNKLKIKLQETAKANPVPSIDPETATVDEVTDHITKALGSHGDTNVIDNAGIDKLLKRKDITDDQRSMLGSLTEANIARKNVTDRATNKSISEVRDDIYNGDAGTDFKGVDAYRQGIIHHLEAGRMEEAQKQLDGLKAFRDRHQQKSDEVTDIYNTMVSKNSGNLDVLSEVQQAIYTQRKKENSKFLIHPITSKNYVPTIQEEARALNAEVKLAESLITVHKNKGQVVASPVVSSTSTANPAFPIITPVDTYAQVAPGVKEKKQPKKQKNPKAKPTPDPKKDSLVTMIARLGGIRSSDIDDHKDIARTLKNVVAGETGYIGHVIHKNGISLDDMRGALVERGYLQEDDDLNVLRDMLDSSSRGSKHYSSENDGDVEAAYKAHEEAILSQLTQKEIDEALSIDLSEDEEAISNEIVGDILNDDDGVSGLDYYLDLAERGELNETGNQEKDTTDVIQDSKGITDQDTKEVKASPSSQESVDEINDSTDEKTSANLSSILDPKYDSLNVTYEELYTGEEVTDKTYAQAMAEIDEEIKEAKAILKCFGA